MATGHQKSFANFVEGLDGQQKVTIMYDIDVLIEIFSSAESQDLNQFENLEDYIDAASNMSMEVEEQQVRDEDFHDITQNI